MVLAACAGQTGNTGTATSAGQPVPTQLIEVTTNPILATCTLSSNGEPMGTVFGTPGTFSAVRSDGDLLVTCTKDGYHPASERLVPTRGGGVAARLVPEGLVPDRADARSGRYPKQVTLYLTPTRFEDDYARKQHGKLMRQRIAAEAEAAKRAVARDCRSGLFSGFTCGSASRAIDDRMAEELAILHRRLQSARIVPDR